MPSAWISGHSGSCAEVDQCGDAGRSRGRSVSFELHNLLGKANNANSHGKVCINGLAVMRTL